MTQPTIVAFVFDGPNGPPKIVIRTLLLSTGHRGVIVENMYAVASNGSEDTFFTFWGYSDSGEESLVRGSGLYIGIEGKALYHHFVLSRNLVSPIFQSGTCRIRVYAKSLGKKGHERLGEFQIVLSDEEAATLARKTDGVLFDLEPQTGRYVGNCLPGPHAKYGAFSKA